MRTLQKGILIAIEGIDGSGKSSLAHYLFTSLQDQQYPVILTKEPGATALGKKLRAIVQEKNEPITAQAEFLLFAADRAQHFQETIIPALNQKKIIISDRMADSSLVYQGYGRGLDTVSINFINRWVMHDIKPDLTFYVRVSPSVAQDRLKARNIKLTAFEKEGITFMQKLIDGFDTLYHTRTDVIIIDGNQSFDAVTHYATQKLNEWLLQQK